MADDAVSTRSTFDWDAVPLDLLRALVASTASRDEKAHVAAASPEQLIDAASRGVAQLRTARSHKP
jgi:type II secretory pathway component PulK